MTQLMTLTFSAGDLLKCLLRKLSLLTSVQFHDKLPIGGLQPVLSTAQFSTRGLFCMTRAKQLICIYKICGEACSEPVRGNSISKIYILVNGK